MNNPSGYADVGTEYFLNNGTTRSSFGVVWKKSNGTVPQSFAYIQLASFFGENGNRLKTSLEQNKVRTKFSPGVVTPKQIECVDKIIQEYLYDIYSIKNYIDQDREKRMLDFFNHIYKEVFRFHFKTDLYGNEALRVVCLKEIFEEAVLKIKMAEFKEEANLLGKTIKNEEEKKTDEEDNDESIAGSGGSEYENQNLFQPSTSQDEFNSEEIIKTNVLSYDDHECCKCIIQ